MSVKMQTTAMVMRHAPTFTDRITAIATLDTQETGRIAQILMSVKGRQTTAMIMPHALTLKDHSFVHATRITLEMELTAMLRVTLLHVPHQMVTVLTIHKEPHASVTLASYMKKTCANWCKLRRSSLL
jgi:hypothetical protein